MNVLRYWQRCRSSGGWRSASSRRPRVRMAALPINCNAPARRWRPPQTLGCAVALLVVHVVRAAGRARRCAASQRCAVR